MSTLVDAINEPIGPPTTSQTNQSRNGQSGSILSPQTADRISPTSSHDLVSPSNSIGCLSTTPTTLQDTATAPTSTPRTEPNVFTHPVRPNNGTVGRTIPLRANYFQVQIPNADLHHYDVDIKPDKCPRRVNREIVENMVDNFRNAIFQDIRPVFDGRRNMYTARALPIDRQRVELDVTLPGEGRERTFRVTIKVSLVLDIWIKSHILQFRTSLTYLYFSVFVQF